MPARASTAVALRVYRTKNSRAKAFTLLCTSFYAPATLPSEKKTAETGVSLLSRRAASALGLRLLQPYVPLCCGPSASALWRDTPVPADYFLTKPSQYRSM